MKQRRGKNKTSALKFSIPSSRRHSEAHQGVSVSHLEWLDFHQGQGDTTLNDRQPPYYWEESPVKRLLLPLRLLEGQDCSSSCFKEEMIVKRAFQKRYREDRLRFIRRWTEAAEARESAPPPVQSPTAWFSHLMRTAYYFIFKKPSWWDGMIVLQYEFPMAVITNYDRCPPKTKALF